eukprot:CAMPEP_0174250022 /NCGR_PEP_ID=MMETSP0439-20130205/331_1 /TAXON_ID=0 /ORGANISM="Stereomyxa ramosa, Strain Chinc5" /LENGTH=660 /DNA_ID=CAMNT_0015329991 /DNA_START=19 /DNA_END=2001 /DNA_ORIENTATION=-
MKQSSPDCWELPGDDPSTFAHPLDTLSIDECNSAAKLVMANPNYAKAPDNFKFITTRLLEPPKDVVISYVPGTPMERHAKCILVDKQKNCGVEIVVDVTRSRCVSWEWKEDLQPSVSMDEFVGCEQAIRESKEFVAAMAKRGLTDDTLWMVEPWSAGFLGDESERERRIVRAQVWVRKSEWDNGYAHPVSGLVVVIDLNEGKVIKVEDLYNHPIPQEPGNYSARFQDNFRKVKPIHITQPEGVNYVKKGNLIEWQNWSFRIGWNMREGPVLYTVGFKDKGKLRPVLYRASVAEMVVPYGSPDPIHCRKNAFDMGEYGLGMLSNPLELGCDCKGTIAYVDGYLCNQQGESVPLPNCVCLHEEDYGMLWKHTDWRKQMAGQGGVDVRRSTRFVLSNVATVGNYEYGFYWYFYMDASLELEVKMTGLVNTSALPEGEQYSKYATTLAPGLAAQIHQHHFSVRLDPHIDGQNNSFCELNTRAEDDDKNPYGNAFFAETTVFKTEKEAQRNFNPWTARYWKVINPNRKTRQGYPTGWKLVVPTNSVPFAKDTSWIMKRAAHLKKHIWVTTFNEDEYFPAGDYPNQSIGRQGLEHWTKRNNNIDNTDIVVWCNFGVTHVVRLEDYPVMPTEYAKIVFKPCNFFDENPTLDVPPAEDKASVPAKCCL